jgi:hypothetical protein
MPAGKRHSVAAASIETASQLKRAAFDVWVQPISPLFDPRRVLLRRIFFIDSDRTRYVSVGYCSARSYDVLVEFGGSRVKSIALTEANVRTLAEHLPTLCEKMCSYEQYQCENGNFKLFTTRAYRTARLKLGDNYIVYNLSYLQYLSHIVYLIHKQQIHYLESMPEVMDYAVSALTATDYVEAPVNANKYIVYPVI